MSDYNVVIQEVDTAMDMLESFLKEMQDVQAHASFDISSLIASVNRKIDICYREMEECADDNNNQNYESDDTDAEKSIKLCYLEEKLSRLFSIKTSCEEYGTDLIDQLNDMCKGTSELVNIGLHEMGGYISKLNLISGMEQAYGNAANYPQERGITYVCVIDSSRYPQTAEHIRIAQSIGFPDVLTIDRNNAADRRKASLENVRASKIYDRDEYPCAVFSEGGSGSDVFYVEGSDNRGAGAYMRWQMQNMPDGARVRIRVI